MKVGQVYKIKEAQRQEGLPEEISIKTVHEDGEELTVITPDGDWESSVEIVNMLYDLKEEFSADTLPKLTMEAIDEISALIDAFVQTGNGMAGLAAKTKLATLKENIMKATGAKPAAPKSLLGRKVV